MIVQRSVFESRIVLDGAEDLPAVFDHKTSYASHFPHGDGLMLVV